MRMLVLRQRKGASEAEEGGARGRAGARTDARQCVQRVEESEGAALDVGGLG